MDTANESLGWASPHVENGYLKIAHEIAEAFSTIKISGNEWRVLWVILRKTYGWNKKMDRIPITQFQKGTGLKRRHVSRALNSLVERHIVTKNGDGFVTSYGLQKDYTQWKAVTKNGDKSKTVTKDGPKLSPKMVHSKALQKQNIGRSKKETDPRVNDFFSFWGEIFLQETGQSYVFSFEKEGKIARGLLKVHDLPGLENLTRQFFRDEQCRRRGLTIGIFLQEINRLVGQKATDPIEQAKREQRLRAEEQGRS